MDDFVKTQLKKAFDVSSIITVHYFEYDKDFIFQGEAHDFWELVYADKGEVCVFFNDEWQTLSAGYAIFHKPMQFHNIRANGKTAPNVIVLSFECRSELMDYFSDRMIYASQKEKDLIADIIRYAGQAFTTRLDDPFVKKLVKSGNTIAEHRIALYIEELLISFYARQNTEKNTMTSTMVNKSSTLDRTTEYMRSHITENLTIGSISAKLSISDSELKRIFKEHTGMGVITYFRNMRIDTAKQLIREGELNITQIADKLGYDSIHHFSKQFKAIVGMSPREYSMSIKMWLDSTNITR